MRIITLQRNTKPNSPKNSILFLHIYHNKVGMNINPLKRTSHNFAGTVELLDLQGSGKLKV